MRAGRPPRAGARLRAAPRAGIRVPLCVPAAPPTPPHAPATCPPILPTAHQHRAADERLLLPGSRPGAARRAAPLCGPAVRVPTASLPTRGQRAATCIGPHACRRRHGAPLCALPSADTPACLPAHPLVWCREQGPQGREVYNSYAAGLFLLFAGWEVRRATLRRAVLCCPDCRRRCPCGLCGPSPANTDRPAAAAPLAQAIQLARGWARLRALEAAEAAAAAGAAAAGGAAGLGFVAWSAVVLVCGSAICKMITQLVEQKGCAGGQAICCMCGASVWACVAPPCSGACGRRLGQRCKHTHRPAVGPNRPPPTRAAAGWATAPACSSRSAWPSVRIRAGALPCTSCALLLPLSWRPNVSHRPHTARPTPTRLRRFSAHRRGDPGGRAAAARRAAARGRPVRRPHGVFAVAAAGGAAAAHHFLPLPPQRGACLPRGTGLGQEAPGSFAGRSGRRSSSPRTPLLTPAARAASPPRLPPRRRPGGTPCSSCCRSRSPGGRAAAAAATAPRRWRRAPTAAPRASTSRCG